ncbi:MAG: hypothetical protein ACREDI_04285, partial [Roseiarcus sp.]
MAFVDFSAYLLDCRVHVSRGSNLEVWIRGARRFADRGVSCCLFPVFFLDRDRLQSEEFVLKERALQLKYRQGANAEVVD